jgi:hypothetical protein
MGTTLNSSVSVHVNCRVWIWLHGQLMLNVVEVLHRVEDEFLHVAGREVLLTEHDHRHGPAEGHREAHCNDPASPYWKTGYNLALAGTWSGRQR